jgi:Putative intracellular protease/amidase
MGKLKVLVLATNYGSWGEELQAPWDALKKAGYDLTLATPKGLKPLPLQISVDPDFFDGVQKYKTNPPEVCDRIKALVDGDEWAHPIKIKEAKMADYDALVLTGGLGAMIDIANDYNTHKLILDAIRDDKIVGALCYAVATLVFCRDPKKDYKSVVYGKDITAHPRAWDFYGPDMAASYELYGETPDNKHTDVITPGFLYPEEDLIRDAVGPDGNCISRITTSRDDPEANFSYPFVTAASVESSRAYGDLLVKVLDKVAAGEDVSKQNIHL